jgi:hypothetical protein
MSYPLLHTCVTTDGSAILGSHGNNDVLVLETTLDLVERRKRIRALAETLGEPWVPIPNMAGHRVIGEIEGCKITAEAGGYAFNDAKVLDRICGAGTYVRVMPEFERRVLEMARALYDISSGRDR